jgi:hypothetical protein
MTNTKRSAPCKNSNSRGFFSFEQRVSLLVAVVSLTPLGLPLLLRPLKQDPCSSPLQVVTPARGHSVHQFEPVNGLSPHGNALHYLVVANEQNEQWIVDGPFRPISCRFLARATFGEEGLGLGEAFDIWAIVSETQLRLGRIATFPLNTVASRRVTVHRAD